MKKQKWFVYILKCGDKSLYTGITNDLKRRLLQHNNGSGARYTRSRLPVKLVYSETAKSRGAALTREWEIKKLTRSQKKKLAVCNRPRRASVRPG
ncbi:MAG: GIY-YIG nuclease family protein [Deltaproteobacteria bacterium]|nr:GIY-YIG nuclease family protein [Deltaproteobacteria bacterium]